MAMSKKDYVAIAKAIKECKPQTQGTHFAEAVADAIARQIANHCAADNPRFDRRRFLEACGVATS